MFEAANQIDDIAARDRSTGRRAKMRSASERAGFVDQTIACFWMEHWARFIKICRQRCSAGGAQCFRRDERFAFRQIGRATGQFEMTTLGLARAIPLNRPLGKIDIHSSRFVERGFFQRQISTAHVVAEIVDRLCEIAI